VVVNANAKQLYDDALSLPDSDRAELAARLIETLDPEVDRDVEAAWAKEIEHRTEQLDSGAVSPVPWNEARRRLQTGR